MAVLPTYVPLATTTLASPQTSVTFTSIPTGYNDLCIITNTATGTSSGSVCIRVGSGGSTDSGNNYSGVYTYGNGYTSATGVQKTTSIALMVAGGWQYGWTTGVWGMCETHIFQYANTSMNKTSITKNGFGGTFVERAGQTWKSTAAIDTITIFNNAGGTLIAGTTISIYGI
jgi:hypothetical protein